MNAVQNVEYVGGQTGFFFGDETELKAYIKQTESFSGKQSKFKIQVAAKNFYSSFPLSKLGLITRYNRNIAAIETLQALQHCQSDAMYSEQSILAKYVGWGGVQNAFDFTTSNSKWLQRCEKLKGLIDNKQYNSARQSTLSSFFTPDSVSAAIYKGMEAAGVNKLKNGTWLDTSAGVGGLLRTMPESIASNVNLTLVEKDDISAQILEHLYPHSNIHHCAFEQAELNKKFDMVYHNPPFGSAKVFDKDKVFSGLSLHNYFLTKSASLLNNKAWMVAIVSSSFMDAQNKHSRELVNQYASLIAAVRLPKKLFEVSTGANATVDLLVFEKGSTVNDAWLESTLQLDKNGNEYSLNNYYIENPSQIVGEMEVGKVFRGNSVHCIAGDDFESLSIDAITRTLSSLKYSVSQAPKSTSIKPTQQTPSFVVTETAGTKNGSYAIGSDNEIYQLHTKNWVATDFSGKAKDRLTGLCGLRHSLMSLLDAEQTNGDESKMESIRKQLNDRYDLFTKTFGFISDSANQRVCKLDPTNYNLLSLERDYSAGVTPTQAKKLGVSVVKPTCAKAEIFTQRVMIPWQAPKSAETVQDSLLASLNVHGKVDLNYCAELLDIPVNTLVSKSDGDLIFNDNGNWVTKNVYQSGDIKTKVSLLETCGHSDQLKSQYQKALNEVLPLDVQFEDIEVGLGASWVPSTVYEEFINSLCDGKQNNYTKIEIMYLNNEWHLNLSCLPHSLESNLGDNNYPFSKLIKKLMNGRGTEVSVTDANGKRTIDTDASLNNELNSGLIQSEWENFLQNNTTVQTQLCKLFNERFNRYSPLKSLDNMMLLPDSNQSIKLREHQLKAVYRGITEGRLLLNHVVGSGKSYSIAAIAHELIRLGLKQRCVIVVPNHLTSQFAGQYLTLYPADQITVLSPDELSPKVRQASLLRLKTGSSIVICPESSFAAISPDSDIEQSVIESEICKLDQALSDVDQSGKRFTVKNIENRKANLEARLKELSCDNRKTGLTISDLGIDALFCDEAHSLKNLAYDSSRLTNVKGTNTPTGSKRAFDWYLKVKCLKANNSNGLGVFLATGTPIANSLLEVYTFSRYLAEEEVLESNGTAHIDSWVSAFADIKSDFEISATGSGSFKPVTRLRSFTNLSQLKAHWSLFTDSVSAQELLGYLPKLEKVDANNITQYFDAIPRITGGKAQQIIVEPTDLQLDFSKSLVQRANNFKASKTENDNMLLIMNHARKASIDMRLLNKNLPPELSGNKIPTAAKLIAKKYHETTSVKGTQLVFLDMGVPNKDGRHCVYDDLRDQLSSLGVQESEIVFSQNYKTPIAKSELYSKLNQGIFRIAIASTLTLGCGANVNKKLVGINLMDTPLRPCDLEQRLGRGIRQGSELLEANPDTFTLDINYFATKNSLDSFLFQVLENKQKFISEFHSNNELGLKKCDDIASTELTFAELKAQTSGSPLVLEMVSLTKTIQLLEVKKKSFLRNKRSASFDIENQENLKQKAQKMVDQLTLDMQIGLSPVKGDKFTFTSDSNQVFTKFSSACDHIHDQLKNTVASIALGFYKNADFKIGSFAGFNLDISVQNTTIQLILSTDGIRKYHFNIDSSKANSIGRSILSTVNNFIEKMNNHLEHYETRLSDATDRLEHAKKISKSDFNEANLLIDVRREVV